MYINQIAARYGDGIGCPDRSVADNIRFRGVRQPTMNVPFLDLKPGYSRLREEIEAAVGAVFDQCNFVLGEPVAQFEEECAAFCGAAHAVSVASGTDAIRIALRGCGAAKGDGVITSPLTFVATAESINSIGARPFFCDIDPVTANVSPAAVRHFLESQCHVPEKGACPVHRETGIPVKGIIPVHLYGQCADMAALNGIARAWNLFVVEDAAQAFGAGYELDGKSARAGTLGAAAAFSFYPSKNLGGAGDGGMITTDDERVADICRVLRVHGAPSAYRFEESGYNSRLDTIQAVVLRIRLKYVEEWLEARRRKAAFYASLFRETAAKASVDTLEAADLAEPVPARGNYVVLPSEAAQCTHTYNSFNIRVSDRNGFTAFLRERGVGTNVYYPKPLHRTRVFEFLGYAQGDMPVAESLSNHICALPMFPEISEVQQTYVVDQAMEYLKANAPGSE